jgi:hypothetical protein
LLKKRKYFNIVFHSFLENWRSTRTFP